MIIHHLLIFLRHILETVLKGHIGVVPTVSLCLHEPLNPITLQRMPPSQVYKEKKIIQNIMVLLNVSLPPLPSRVNIEFGQLTDDTVVLDQEFQFVPFGPQLTECVDDDPE